MLNDDPGPPGGHPSDTPDDDARRYLDEVRREIDDEVRRRRASGDLPPNIERDLDQLFLAHSPLGGRSAALRDMLRLVDASVFIDPVVPVASRRPGGTAVKRGLRSLSLWYLRYITHQVSEFATAVSRALHVLDVQVTELRRKMDALEVPPSGAVEVPWAHNRDAWWVEQVARTLTGRRGRVLHAACGRGWLVDVLVARDVDAYGVDRAPRDRGSSSTTWTCASRTSTSTWERWPRGRSGRSCCPGSSRGRARSRDAGSWRVRSGPWLPGVSCSSIP